MAKILNFRSAKKDVPPAVEEAAVETDSLEDDVNAILSDYSLTPANRRWVLENMLMDIDEQLEGYRKELERAELELDAVVQAAEKEIATAYFRFDTQVRGMTQAVKKLTKTRRKRLEQEGLEAAGNAADSQGNK